MALEWTERGWIGMEGGKRCEMDWGNEDEARLITGSRGVGEGDWRASREDLEG